MFHTFYEYPVSFLQIEGDPVVSGDFPIAVVMKIGTSCKIVGP